MGLPHGYYLDRKGNTIQRSLYYRGQVNHGLQKKEIKDQNEYYLYENGKPIKRFTQNEAMEIMGGLVDYT